MKAFPFLIAVLLVSWLGVASACGTHAPAEQAEIDAKELAELQKLTRAVTIDSEEIFVGTVTELTRPSQGKPEFGSVSFTVEETIKGQPSSTRTVKWKDKFIYSCQPSAMFHNVGFRPGGKFVVYLNSGEVLRSEAADHLRTGLLTLEQELAIAVSAGDS